MKRLILAFSLLLTAGLVAYGAGGTDPCLDHLKQAQKAHAQQLHARVLHHLKPFFGNPECRPAADGTAHSKALLLAADARPHVREIKGIERQQYIRILRRIPKADLTAKHRLALMQTLIRANRPDAALALVPKDWSTNTRNADLKSLMMAFAAAKKAGRLDQQHALLGYLTTQNKQPLLAAFMRLTETEPKAATVDQLLGSMMSGQSLDSATVRALWQSFQADDRLLMLKVALMARSPWVAPAVLADATDLSDQEAAAVARLLRQAKAWGPLATLDSRMAEAASPETAFLICFARWKQGDAQQGDAQQGDVQQPNTCAPLASAQDYQNRYGVAFGKPWIALFSAIDAGRTTEAIDHLVTLNRFDRLSAARQEMLAVLYHQVGETEMAGRIHTMLKMMGGADSYAPEQQGIAPEETPLQQLFATLENEAITEDTLSALRAMSPQSGLLWRRAEAAHFMTADDDKSRMLATLQLRHVAAYTSHNPMARATPLLKLSSVYADVGDEAGVTDSLLIAAGGYAPALGPAYALSLGYYQKAPLQFGAKPLADLWAKLAWIEARAGNDPTSYRPLVNRTSLLLRLAQDTDDKDLKAASCSILLEIVKDLEACNASPD